MEILKNYGNFIKVEHTLFSLPLILSGAFLAANGVPEMNTLMLILFAGVGARTAALGLRKKGGRLPPHSFESDQH